jgi:hypothetical protein
MTPEQQQKFVLKVECATHYAFSHDEAQTNLNELLAPLFAALEAGQAMRDAKDAFQCERSEEQWDAALAHLQEVVSK